MSRGRRRTEAAEGATASDRTPKACAICGRRIEWRRRWADDWAAVRYCSDACRRRRREDTGRLEQAILSLLDQRARDATICPSEVARAQGGEAWQPLMEPVREAARRLVARGEVDITQGGRIVDPSTATGPIRIRRRT